MLQSIRDRASGWFAYAIVLLISIPFALWGINHYLDGGGKQVAAQVGSTSISIGRFEQAYRLEQARIAQTFGGQIPSQVSDKMIKQAALRELIQEAVLAQAVGQAGYRITNKDLLKEILSIPVFQHAGQFSRATYEQVLAAQGMTPHVFENRLRRQLSIEQFQSGIMSTSFVTSKEADSLDTLRNEQRNVDMAVIPLSRFFAGIKLSNGSIKQYYDKHQSEFMSAEKVRIAYLMLDKKVLLNQIKPTSGELEQYYKEHNNKYKLPRRAKVSEIVLNVTKNNHEKVMALASELQKRAFKNPDFYGIARKYSQNKESSIHGGSIGVVSASSFPTNLWVALQPLNAGEVSKPVEYDSKVYLLKLDAWLPDETLPYAKVKDQVRKDYMAEQAASLFNSQLQRLSDLTYQHPGSLDPAAKSLGLDVIKSDWFSQGDGTGLVSNPVVVKAAFSKAVFQNGTNSGVINLSNGSAIVLRIADKRAPRAKSLDEVKLQIQGILERTDAEDAAKALAKRMRGNLATGKRLQALAVGNHLSYRALGWLGRDDKNIPGSIVKAAFDLPPPENGKESVGSAKLGNGDYAIFSVKSVKWPKANVQANRKFRNELSARVGESEMLILFQSIEKSMNIKIYPNNLNL